MYLKNIGKNKNHIK